MSCKNPQCYNFNKTVSMYCDKCIQAEIDKMSYDELVDMYAEGKEWLDNIKFNKSDETSIETINKFREGWFALMNITLLARRKK